MLESNIGALRAYELADTIIATMSRLPEEPQILPDNLLEFPVETMPWWVAHVRSRQEKSFARTLARIGTPYFLPQSQATFHRNGRTLRSYLPLFAGYVFLRGTTGELTSARRDDAVVRILAVPDQDLLQQELRQLRTLQLLGLPIIPLIEYVPGDAVRIKSGVFSGTRGIVTRIKGKERLVVNISFLKRSLTVELDHAALAPILTERSATAAGY